MAARKISTSGVRSICTYFWMIVILQCSMTPGVSTFWRTNTSSLSHNTMTFSSSPSAYTPTLIRSHTPSLQPTVTKSETIKVDQGVFYSRTTISFELKASTFHRPGTSAADNDDNDVISSTLHEVVLMDGSRLNQGSYLDGMKSPHGFLSSIQVAVTNRTIVWKNATLANQSELVSDTTRPVLGLETEFFLVNWSFPSAINLTTAKEVAAVVGRSEEKEGDLFLNNWTQVSFPSIDDDDQQQRYDFLLPFLGGKVRSMNTGTVINDRLLFGQCTKNLGEGIGENGTFFAQTETIVPFNWRMGLKYALSTNELEFLQAKLLEQYPSPYFDPLDQHPNGTGGYQVTFISPPTMAVRVIPKRYNCTIRIRSTAGTTGEQQTTTPVPTSTSDMPSATPTASTMGGGNATHIPSTPNIHEGVVIFTMDASIGEELPPFMAEVEDSCGGNVKDAIAYISVVPAVGYPGFVSSIYEQQTKLARGNESGFRAPLDVSGQLSGPRIFVIARNETNGEWSIPISQVIMASNISSSLLNITFFSSNLTYPDQLGHLQVGADSLLAGIHQPLDLLHTRSFCNSYLIQLNLKGKLPPQEKTVHFEFPEMMSSADFSKSTMVIKIWASFNLFTDIASSAEKLRNAVVLKSNLLIEDAPRGFMFLVQEGNIEFKPLQTEVIVNNGQRGNCSYRYFFEVVIHPNSRAFTHHTEIVSILLDASLIMPAFYLQNYNQSMEVPGHQTKDYSKVRQWFSLVALVGKTVNLGLLSVVRTVSDCSVDQGAPISLVIHPIQIPIGPGSQRYYVGAIFCNSAIVFGVLLITFVIHKIQGEQKSVFPHHALVVANILYPGTVISLFEALQAQNTVVISYLIYAVIVVYGLAFPAIFFGLSKRNCAPWVSDLHQVIGIPKYEKKKFKKKKKIIELEDDEMLREELLAAEAEASLKNAMTKKAKKKHPFARFLLGFGHYEFCHMDHLRARVTFEQFRGPIARASVVEVLYSSFLAMGALFACPQANIPLLVVLAIHVAFIFIVHPYLSVARNTLMVILDMIMIVSCVTFLRGSEGMARSAFDVVQFTAASINVLGILLDVWCSHAFRHSVDWLIMKMNTGNGACECMVAPLQMLQRHLYALLDHFPDALSKLRTQEKFAKIRGDAEKASYRRELQEQYDEEMAGEGISIKDLEANDEDDDDAAYQQNGSEGKKGGGLKIKDEEGGGFVEIDFDVRNNFQQREQVEDWTPKNAEGEHEDMTLNLEASIPWVESGVYEDHDEPHRGQPQIPAPSPGWNKKSVSFQEQHGSKPLLDGSQQGSNVLPIPAAKSNLPASASPNKNWYSTDKQGKKTLSPNKQQAAMPKPTKLGHDDDDTVVTHVYATPNGVFEVRKPRPKVYSQVEQGEGGKDPTSSTQSPEVPTIFPPKREPRLHEMPRLSPKPNLVRDQLRAMAASSKATPTLEVDEASYQYQIL